MSTVRPFQFILIACLCALSPATADPPEPTWDQLKESVDQNGRVKTSGVKAPTFRSAMGVRWQILQPGETGEAQPVHLLDTFRTGDRYRLKVESLTDATVYLLRQKPDGTWEHTDEPKKGVWAVKAGAAVELPSATGWFQFEDAGGEDGRSRFRLLCTVNPLPDADRRRLVPLVERLAGGKEVDAGDRPLKARYTPVDGKGDALAVEKGGLKASPPTKSPDGKDPILVRQVGAGRWHAAVLADARAEADWLLAHDIALDHTKGGKAVGGRFDPKKVYALLIGVGEYEYCQNLTYTGRDATQVANFLATLGVPAENVVLLRDGDADPNRRPTAKNIRDAMDAFFRRPFPKGSDVWFYFSGHGLHDPVTGTSYLLPRDPPTFPNDPQKKFTTAELLQHSISVTDVKGRLSDVPDARLRVMFLDACRRDGTAQAATAASLKSALGGGDLLVYSSCEASQVSLEDRRHQHGVFTCQLLDGLRGLGVSSVAHPDQWVTSVSLHDKLILGTRQQLASYHRSQGENDPPERPTDQRPTLLYPRELGAMNLCPATAFRNSVGMALLRLREGDGVFGSPKNEPGRGGLEYEQQTLRMKWPPKDGKGRRLVYMGQYEVTQGQYAEVMVEKEGKWPAYFRPDGPGKEFVTDKAKGGPNLPRRPDQMPVESVSWYDANDFCDKLTERENDKLQGAGYRVRYRLPTEEEWEYACRAGTTGPFATQPTVGGDGDKTSDPDLLWGEVDDVTDKIIYGPTMWRGYVCSAVFDPSDLLSSKAARAFDAKNPGLRLKPRVRPEPVGEARVEFNESDYRLAANDWGFHDMHGNVAEWTATRYDPADHPPKKLTAPRPPVPSPELVTGTDTLIVRGGSWQEPAAACRSASRTYSKPKPVSGGVGDGHRIGFRVVCEVLDP